MERISPGFAGRRAALLLALRHHPFPGFKTHPGPSFLLCNAFPAIRSQGRGRDQTSGLRLGGLTWKPVQIPCHLHQVFNLGFPYYKAWGRGKKKLRIRVFLAKELLTPQKCRQEANQTQACLLRLHTCSSQGAPRGLSEPHFENHWAGPSGPSPLPESAISKPATAAQRVWERRGGGTGVGEEKTN